MAAKYWSRVAWIAAIALAPSSLPLGAAGKTISRAGASGYCARPI